MDAPVVGQRLLMPGGFFSTFTGYGLVEAMTDFVGNPNGDNALDHTRCDIEGSIMNYNTQAGSYLVDYPSALYANYSLSDNNGPLGPLLNKLLASGPLTPRMRLPVSLFELKDIPRMVKHGIDLFLHLRGWAGKPGFSGLNATKEAAAANLAYQFGWAPLIEDFGKMLNFVQNTEKTRRALNKAASNRGLKRRVKLGESSNASYTNSVMHSTGGMTIIVPVKTLKTTRSWGVCRWKLKSGGPVSKMKPLQPERFDPFRTAYGLNPGQQFANVWKALPWSWMFDWFLNLSNVLDAANNLAHYNVSGVVIMRETKAVDTHPMYPVSNPTISAGQRTRVKQLRTPLSNPTPQIAIQLPILDNFRLSILASLAVVRLDKGRSLQKRYRPRPVSSR